MDSEFVGFVADILKIDPSGLKAESTAAEVPEWDSLNHWVIIGKLEEKYGIEFTMDEAIDFTNLGDIYGLIMKKKQG